MSALKDLHGKIAERRVKLAGIFDSTRADDGRYNLTSEQRAEVKSLNDELTDLGKQYDTARADADMERANAEAIKGLKEPVDDLPFRGHRNATKHGAGDEPEDTRSIGQRFVDSRAFKSWHGADGRSGAVQFTLEEVDPFASLKTTMTTAAGWAPPNNRGPLMVPYAQRRPVVADLIPQDPTTVSTVKYMEETTNTNNAASVSENAAKPESALGFTERSVPVEVIATTLPITEQQIDDVPALRGIIDNRLTLQLMLTEEVELLTGTGTTPHLQGILTKSGIQTQGVGADPVPSAIYKAMTLIRYTGFAEPSAVVAHPNDWQDIRLLQTTTGEYIWGSPADAGPERIWGLPVVVTTAETENTILVGDFRMYDHISRRMGITIKVGYVNDDFKYNRFTIRAEERLSQEVLRPSAFAKVTGA